MVATRSLTPLSSRVGMAEVSHHTDEIDLGGTGVPVSWRAAAREGTPTLYVHGVPNSSLMWQPFLERTGGVALDLPGFGDSVKAATFPFSIAGYDGYIERFLDWLELDRVNLVMHDWGAAALAFAQRAPERVERIVLIDALPLFDGYDWHRARADLAHAGARRAGDGLPDAAPAAPRAALRQRQAATRARAARDLRDARLRHPARDPEALPQRQAGHARRRRRAPRRARRAGADRLGRARPLHPRRAPRSSTRTALGGECGGRDCSTDAGHWPWLDRPDAASTRVADFLAQS